MKESQLRNEMREEIAQKDLLLTQLQNRAKELQETLSRVQENETTSKHDVALLLKEKVRSDFTGYNIDRRKLFGYGHNYFLL
jgi:hypoxanthine-guanine phosphoribosyltransferase